MCQYFNILMTHFYVNCLFKEVQNKGKKTNNYKNG